METRIVDREYGRKVERITAQLLFVLESELLGRLDGGEISSLQADLKKIKSAGEAFKDYWRQVCQGGNSPWSVETLAELRHNLRTPLNHIIGYGEMLLEEIAEPGLDHLTVGLQQVCDLARMMVGEVAAIGVGAKSFGDEIEEGDVPVDQEAAAQGAVILVVDDAAQNRELLSRKLDKLGHTVKCAEDGYQALALINREDFDLILLDLMMPKIDGKQVLKALKSSQQLRHIPVIMISALNEMDNVVQCIEMGAEDYLTKPFNQTLLKARVKACLEKKRLYDQEQVYRQKIEDFSVNLERRVQEQVSEITTAQVGTIFALSKVAESKDKETGDHIERIYELVKILVREMARCARYEQLLDEQYMENLCVASALHDLGKVGVPDQILQKQGKLTAEEFEVMKSHTMIGAKTLREVEAKYPGNNLLKLGMVIAEAHHEKWNGRGYPYGLAGEEIPLPGRIVALADVYDALRARRVYKEPFSHEKARAITIEEKGVSFDPELVDIFLAVEEEFEILWKE